MRTIAWLLVLLTTATAQAARRPAGTFVRVPPPAGPAIVGTRNIVFMNRDGGRYHPGAGDDSTTNTTGLVLSDSDAIIPPFPHGDAVWNQIMSCVRDQFAPFDVEITDLDPGTVPHLEHVVGGHVELIGRSNAAGIATMHADCSPALNAISFTFAEVYRDSEAQLMCETAAQEIAHNLGLEHEYLCQDPMTYLEDCGTKRFQDVDAQCGEYAPRPCDCPGRTTQNSVRLLRQILGTRGQAPPALTITYPPDGATVPADLDLTLETSAATGIYNVNVYLDGEFAWELRDEQIHQPVRLWGLSQGTHVVRVLSTANDGQQAQQQVTVGVGTEPTPQPDAAPIGGGPDAGPGQGGGGATPEGEDGVVSGGCAAGGSDGPGWLGVLLLAALLGRRRRAQA